MPATGSPLGMYPFGCGTPIAAVVPPTGDPRLSRYINGATGDYEQDTTTGHFRTMPSVRQRVLITLLTIYGSSTVLPEMGLRRPTKIDASYVRTTQANVRAALYQMTDVERVLKLDLIDVQQTTSGRGQLTVSFTDLTTGARDRISQAL